MKKTTVILLATVILLTLSACRDSAIIGKWYSQSEENTVTFEKNGDFEIQFWDGDCIKGSYVVGGDSVTLYDTEGRVQDIRITVNGDEMTVLNQTYKK